MDNLPSGRPGTAPEIGGESGSKSGSKTIHNDILDSPRTGSALKVDDVKPIYEINEKTGKPQIIKEFPATAQAHGFNDLVDNYAGYATKTTLNDATLYQLEGSLNGVEGKDNSISPVEYYTDANYNYLYEKNKHWLKDEVYFLIHNEK